MPSRPAARNPRAPSTGRARGMINEAGPFWRKISRVGQAGADIARQGLEFSRRCGKDKSTTHWLMSAHNHGVMSCQLDAGLARSYRPGLDDFPFHPEARVQVVVPRAAHRDGDQT